MELYQLKTFVKVADEGNLTRAAELLFTSQPAISAHIKALEEELGVELFQRTPKGMQLTPSGELLYQKAAGILASADELKSAAQSLRQELVGELKIGVHTDFEFVRIAELLRVFTAKHPRIQLHFLAGMSATNIPDVRKGNLDGGFFFGPVKSADLTTLELAQVPMKVVAPAAWRNRVEQASPEALCALPWIYTSQNCPFYTLRNQMFSGYPCTPNKVAFVDSEDAIRELIRAGSGIALLRQDDAETMEREGVGYCWSGEVPSIALSFTVQKRRQNEPLIQAAIKEITALWGVEMEAPLEKLIDSA
ncbi:LysR family transcriptional regulator [Sedimenticola sp.]|uniref:LysR family transcriptional regulator n=1 Tax=Sedimenticola sp. TaxID=1940285 RepID=UPI003D11B7CE